MDITFASRDSRIEKTKKHIMNTSVYGKCFKKGLQVSLFERGTSTYTFVHHHTRLFMRAPDCCRKICSRLTTYYYDNEQSRNAHNRNVQTTADDKHNASHNSHSNTFRQEDTIKN